MSERSDKNHAKYCAKHLRAVQNHLQELFEENRRLRDKKDILEAQPEAQEERLMPEGMEWPRDGNGEPITFDELYKPSLGALECIAFYSNGYVQVISHDGLKASPSSVTREKPEPADTWELWKQDLCRPSVSYCAKRGLDGNRPADAKEDDLVRRAKALAERDAR